MDDGGLFFGFLGFLWLPALVGIVLGMLGVVLIAIVALHLGFTKLVGVSIDSLRARHRVRAGAKRATKAAIQSSDPPDQA